MTGPSDEPQVPSAGSVVERSTRLTSSRDARDAAVAAVLADAVRDGRVTATDALRIIKHEMRRRNTNKQGKLPYRSVAAQAVIADHESRGLAVPKNGSLDALHADHVHDLGEDALLQTVGEAQWETLLTRARTVVVVTARENYELEVLERQGTRGPAKYEAAGICWAGDSPTF